MYWKAPTENLICGDVDGNIAWQASALTPNRTAPKGDRTRRSWVGRLPVPGTGAYEWEGFRADLPRELNPARGFIATANNNIQPKGYAPPMMFKSANNVAVRSHHAAAADDPAGQTYTLDDHRRMQLDALMLRAQSEIPLFNGWTSSQPNVERARQLLASWDAVLARDSARRGALLDVARPSSTPQERDAARPVAERQTLHEASLAKAIEQLTDEPGRRLERVALGPHAHARVPASARRRPSICRRSSGRAAPARSPPTARPIAKSSTSPIGIDRS